jgi:pyruvate dehydrogenase E1 component beta subunit
MSTQILMPALSPTMEEGRLAKWLIKPGDMVKSGMVIAEIETDKATMEVEAVDEGQVGELLVLAGTSGVKVNTPIATIIAEGAPITRASTAHTAPAYTAPTCTPPAYTSPTMTTQTPIFAAPTYAPSYVQPAPYVPPAHVPAPAIVPVNAAMAPRVSPPPAMQRPNPAPTPSTRLGGETVTQTMREALRDAMAEEMRANPNVFLMGEEVAQYQGAYKVSQGLLEEFGAKRVIDTPITEQGFAGIGVGAALAGLNPIIEFMTWNFAMQAIDQIINSAAKTLYMSGGQMGCPIVFRGPNGAASRVGAQHSQCFSAWYAHVPGLKVVCPSNPADAKGLLKAAIRDPNPVLVLENEMLYGLSGEVPRDTSVVVPIGKARVVRVGHHVTIVSFARGMQYALDAAKTLEADGIDAEVIDLRTLRPIDWATIIASVKKTNRLVTVEEAWPTCSIGSEICAQVAIQAFDYLDAPPAKVAGADVPMPYAANLEKLALPTAADVVAAVRKVCYR